MFRIAYSLLILASFTPVLFSQTARVQHPKAFITTKNGNLRMEPAGLIDISPSRQPLETEPSIFIDESSQFQEMVGIGGAFTDAAAETFYKLSPDKRKELLDLYFDSGKGIGYTLGRANINSCDFSSDMYSYVADKDSALTTFDISHDLNYKLPFIKEAMTTAGNNLKLFVSPWSPPAWMKDNNNMLQGGKLLPNFRQSWAQYYIKFIQAYEAKGVPVWGLTVQNEPMAKQTWESCIYTAQEEADFIRDYLGPTLHKSGMKDKKLIAWDHNRDLIFHRVQPILGDKTTAQYVWGIGFHWYEIWNGGRQYQNLQRVKEKYPETNLLLTEACNYPFDWATFDQWQWGENYGENMINDFNQGAVAWTDWNLLLDEVGGPNHVKNFCFAPVHVKTGENSIHLMNSYYYIGHFSKFIKPGAKRISVSSNRAQLLCTGFINTDGSTAVVVMNATEEKFETGFMYKGRTYKYMIAPRSIITTVFMP
ncbi:MAG: glycoside hydrolase family 30 protein [Saprospiraceae bacterium]|jgi:glucosylceramidase|nr:glycoside hydrolase family 30 protein [Saprospiraceae bacterium]MBP9193656.1 glycoside hydrolase family 30 protein [Saprospiraceae bacterium]